MASPWPGVSRGYSLPLLPPDPCLLSGAAEQSSFPRASAHSWEWSRLSQLAPYPAGAFVSPTHPCSGVRERIALFPGGCQVHQARLTPSALPCGPESGGFQGPGAWAPSMQSSRAGCGGVERKSLLLPPGLSWLCLTWLWPQQPSWMGICLQTGRGLGYPFSAAVPSRVAAPRGGS